ncbi:MAG TPA: flagellar basal body rod protein FlgC [Gammaproteobacteria bacterium]|nr:flagellar basal body rod protein FlgC [Gammaproteobacteria bacterium]MEC8009173.1 flagellar basal body rod protein FlgC [Pseudomonadota bacterium]HBF08383.1 flagellar basal body rod protein FlgC [Gammaproteobacteria bacterium]HCK91623.1 flagellar basal body rod protein FlgC [Gammaproteobacteria bacterium]|tara:strand:+ start:34109 stop:34570 length:462 start_codon:yes stop_codon:yes gene_type:complete
MSLLNIFNISGSGLSAQSLRMNTIASNISNAETTASSVDQVYRARKPVFTANDTAFSGFLSDAQNEYGGFAGAQQMSGVQVAGVVEDQTPLPKRFEPDHPMADEEGYVTYPNVNVVEEMADMISASRAYQMNASMMESGKSMMERLLTVGKSS